MQMSVLVAAGQITMKKSLPIAAVFYIAVLFEPVFAADSFWKTNFGDWTNAANWSNGAVPTAVDSAIIDNGGQANLTAASAKVATTWVGYFDGGGTLLISNAGTLTNSVGYIGYVSSGNKAVVTGAGSLWTNSKAFFVGNQGNGNSLVVSNGGALISGAGRGASYVGEASSNNTVLVTGTGSLWQNNDNLYIGTSVLSFGSLGNTLVVSNGGKVVSANLSGNGGYTYIGYGALAPGNSALITGTDSLLTNTRSLFVGHTSRGNSLVVSNGGKVANADLFIGYTNVATNNSVQVTGTGSLLTNSGNMYVGAGSQSIYSIAPHGGYNSLTIADGGTAASVDGFIGYANFASYNTVLVTGTNSLWTNSRDLYVGFSGRGNRLVITNGGEVFAGGNLVISAQAGATNTFFFDNPTNRVSVGGGRLVVTNGQINVGAATPGALYITGGTVEAKTLTATNGTNSVIAFNGGAINSSATAINNGTNFTIGDTGSGAAFTARVGTHTFASDLVVGNAGSSNSLVITNGGEVFIGTNMVLSAQAGASNNSMSISSGRLVVTNGTLEIGRAGSGTLNIHGGTVEAPSIVVASQAGSSGTLNIGRFGTNDSAGTISAATIAFGAGTGVVNFNQSNAVTITSVISGAGTVRQLGSGTTILSASNTYTGGTTISSGTLELNNTGSVAGSITNNATLSLNRTNTLTLTNLVSGTGALSKSGTGTVILAGANTYSGNTTISAGTLQINAGGSVSNSATTLVGSGGAGTLSISGGTYSNTSVSIGHSGGTGILNLNSGSLSAQNLAVSGNGAVAGTLNLNGGTMAVSGSFSVASGGTINVNTGGVLSGGNGGQLWVDSTNSLVNFNGGTGSSGLNLFVGNGGTVDLRGQSLGSNNWANLVASGLGGVLRNSGTNAATIANPNTIWLWEGGQRLTIDASGGDILINSWITSSQMTNTGIIKTGTNALILANYGNDYNGGTFLQQGTLRLDHANAAGSGAITQSNAGSTLQINATGTVTNAMSLYNIATLQTVTLSGAKTLNGATYNVAAGTTTTESGVLSGAGGLTKSGTGTMTLSASNTYTGATAIGSGVLALTNGSAIADTAAVTNSGATLRVDSSETIGSLRGSGSTVLNGAAVTLTVAETNSQTYAGVISGAGGFAKAGIGTVTFTGANTYSGDTTINAGVLQIDVGGAVSNSTNIYVGKSSSGNSLVISNGGRVANT
jgi:T5SS/PEP-CTERM-associated repeat protein/autotransporter-associated beta strand protein